MTIEYEAAGDEAARVVGTGNKPDLVRGGRRPGNGEGQIGPRRRRAGSCVRAAHPGIAAIRCENHRGGLGAVQTFMVAQVGSSSRREHLETTDSLAVGINVEAAVFGRPTRVRASGHEEREGGKNGESGAMHLVWITLCAPSVSQVGIKSL